MTFEEIFKYYKEKIFRLCMGFTNDVELAQDITQESFITVWQQLPKFRNESGIGTWIYRIATNNCLRQLEKKKRLPKAELPINLAEENKSNIEQQIQLLYQFIAELAEMDKIIILLELENLKQSEIANITGLSESNIRVRIFRIKEKLTEKFKQHGEQ